MLGTKNGYLSTTSRAAGELAGSDTAVSKDLLTLSLSDKEILVFALAEASLEHSLVDGLRA